MKQHANILYKTSNKQYGGSKALIEKEHGNEIAGQYTQHLLTTGMWRNNGLNTVADKERWMENSKAWMDHLS